MNGRPSALPGLDRRRTRRLAVEERHAVVRVEADDEHVRQLDQRAVAALELVALAREAHLRERLLDGRDELLGPERLGHERERARAQRADRGVHRREARDEHHLAEGRRLAQRAG